MDWRTCTMLAAAGLIGRIVNALAGGATLITFPAMLAAGLPPITANASNALAIAPGHLLAAWADRGELPPPSLRIGLSVGAALLGGVLGALLLLVLPERWFVVPVPALIAFATVLFALAPGVQAYTQRAHGGRPASSTAMHVGVMAAASLYGGCFGAGLGIILTAVLSLSGPNDIRAIKALKNMLASAVSLAANVIFIVQGAVHWPATLAMLAGGYLGGYLIRVLPAGYVRWFVIVAGTVTTVIYARRYWF
jgi:uncharacterized membrane protein YfcA